MMFVTPGSFHLGSNQLIYVFLSKTLNSSKLQYSKYIILIL